MGYITDAFKSFFTPEINRVKESFEQKEGVLDLLDDLKLEMGDEELIKLKKEWEKQWYKYEPEIRKKQEENEIYWLGIQDSVREPVVFNSGRPIVDNIIFEALETFLPIATKNNPDPVVSSDNTPEGEALSKNVSAILAYHADRLRLKLRLKRVARYWALYHLGVGKVGWNLNTKDLTFETLRPQKLILDPNATINDDMEYTGEFIGEYKREKAQNLINRFPKKEKEIKKECKDKLGSLVSYIEWWTDDYVFWTMKDDVLGKGKNPYWNWETDQSIFDEFGNETKEKVPGKNHFSIPKKPYVFLSIFNIGKRPFDDTSLIQQNLSNQDIITSRQDQIEKNVRFMNNSMIVSNAFTKEESGRVANELLNGGVVRVDSPNAQTAIAKIPANSLPADVFTQLSDIRNEMRNIFGTRGSTPQGISQEQTVRGKIIIGQQDASRIGGGITEYLEQFADQVYNWFVQIMMVSYDEPLAASILGKDKAREYIVLSKESFDRKLTISVKEGSMLPKDEVTKANQAVDLFGAGIIDPITALDKLNYPDPKGTAERAFLYKAAPQLLFPQAGQAIQMEAQQQAMMQAQTQMDINNQAAVNEAEMANNLPPIPQQ